MNMFKIRKWQCADANECVVRRTRNFDSTTPSSSSARTHCWILNTNQWAFRGPILLYQTCSRWDDFCYRNQKQQLPFRFARSDEKRNLFIKLQTHLSECPFESIPCLQLEPSLVTRLVLYAPNALAECHRHRISTRESCQSTYNARGNLPLWYCVEANIVVGKWRGDAKFVTHAYIHLYYPPLCALFNVACRQTHFQHTQNARAHTN